MARYSGFSTYNKTKKFKVTDVELVKQDLLNHFYTRPGERVMNPTFGSKIWDMLYEPYDASTKNAISEDIGRVIGSEPRVAAQNVTVLEYEHGIKVIIDLIYIKQNLVDRLYLDFKRNIES